MIHIMRKHIKCERVLSEQQIALYEFLKMRYDIQ